MTIKEFFRTILGDKNKAEMGFTYSHEHIIIDDSYSTKVLPEILLNDVDKISKELSGFYEAGGRTMVDTMPANAGRNVLKMVEVSRRSRVQIIIPTGIHLEKYYPENHWRYGYTEDQLTDLFVKDIEEGIDEYDYSGPYVNRTPYKAGIIKVATGDGEMTSHQVKIFSAAVNAHLITGAPIITHTNSGKLALEQAQFFNKKGAKLEHVVISHVDKIKDVNYHKRVLDIGVNVEYDSAVRWELKGQENQTFQLIKELLPIYPNQILMGMDIAKSNYWLSYGGYPGLNYLIKEIPVFLKLNSMSKYHRNIFFDNPQSVYAFHKTS